MNPTSPLAVLRAWVDAYKDGHWHGPGEEIEQALELLEYAKVIIERTHESRPGGWLSKYAAMKGEK